jgi:heme/copper-type cytochrome/quinol oxidase subunit 2
MNVEEQVRAALESVALATRPDEQGAYQRFLRRRAHHDRMQAATAAVLLLVLLAAAVVLPGRLGQAPATVGVPGLPTAAPTVDVTAFQWGWRFAYAGTGVVATGGLGQTAELVVPVDQPIHVRLRSADVVHSFSVPSLRFERQAFPDRVTEFDLTVTEAGTYPGRCGTYCGLAHTEMRFRIRAISGQAFGRWLREAARPRPPRSPFEAGCSPVASGRRPRPGAGCWWSPSPPPGAVLAALAKAP